MAAEQRKLLAQLMGNDALDSMPSQGRDQRVDLHDNKVCKSFLVGVCPHDLFTNTKQDFGPCPKLHVEQYKIEYEHHLSAGKEFPEFDVAFERDLEKYLRDCDRRLEAANKKLERTAEDEERIAAVTRDLQQLDISIALALQEIEVLGQVGEISRALHETIKLEDKYLRREVLDKELNKMFEVSGIGGGHQKLQVCETCGAYLSRLDNDRRLADHFLGKLHVGYRIMREYYKEGSWKE
ncbi:LUC7-domain-containing protein [Nadsonia fulvescens var. elongata DSM 6958]|uniref:LUC7-domain-containing protein n=1 Tax=Nadsonia fulvescens var. elongata DSM 6958 TaxID=857566 RepID=A0A1E3PRY1_9ASCO|nr:LUC7-domain-containing protein [Nadsonia fulvescens var. elongata DSM 6958]